jgi:fructoselysine-6-P-deglycase FrlB-like protein
MQSGETAESVMIFEAAVPPCAGTALTCTTTATS